MSARLRLVQQDLCSLIPDKVAQAAWDRVSDLLASAEETLYEIAWLTVGGEQSRADLTEAGELIEKVLLILQRVNEREAPYFHELEHLAPIQIWKEPEVTP